MTKATTRSGKRRRRKATITLPGGETAHQRPAQGQRVPEPPADAVTMAARSRQTGRPIEACRDPMLECPVGRRLLREHIPDRADLWRAALHLCRVSIAYSKAQGAPRRYPKIAGLLVVADRFEVGEALRIDTRTSEEKDTAAVSAMDALNKWLSYADTRAVTAAMVSVVDMPDQPLSDWSGVVLALRCVADGLAGRPVVDRRRK